VKRIHAAPSAAEALQIAWRMIRNSENQLLLLPAEMAEKRVFSIHLPRGLTPEKILSETRHLRRLNQRAHATGLFYRFVFLDGQSLVLHPDRPEGPPEVQARP
jgi:hypothetical protein